MPVTSSNGVTVLADTGKHPTSVKVYLHTGAKVRHDRIHVFLSDAQRPRRHRRRIVRQIVAPRCEDLSAAVQSDFCIRELGYSALAARKCGGWSTSRLGWNALRSELHRHLAQQRSFSGQVHPRAVDRHVEMQLLVEFCLTLRQLDRDL